jgi:hypothetical protein
MRNASPDIAQIRQLVSSEDTNMLDLLDAVEYLLKQLDAEQWRCFHCGEVFTTPGSARDHFGATEGAEPGCLVDRVALEQGGTPERGRGLLMALRKAEDEIAKLRREVEELENDSRLWHESEADRIRRIGHCQWWQELDSREGERLVLVKRVKELEQAVLNQCGDNLCWVTNDAEVKALPEAEFLESCRRYRLQIVSERGEAAGLKTIAQLEAEIVRLQLKEPK